MYKAMVVDDEEIIVTGLSRLLPWEKYNCELVATASNGEQALKLIHNYKPDILFTDIRMPHMDGLSLIAALRSEHPAMRITIVSGHSDFEYAQQAIRLGVSNYILKPSKMGELQQALAHMVAQLETQTPVPEKSNPLPKNKTNLPTTPTSNDDEQASNFIINNTIQFLEEHYAEKLTLPIVADKVYVSQWHLSKLISKNTGQGFSDLLNGIRIRHAKILLENPSYKIWEISERVGFSDVTHFSRIFKKLEKCSANEYRNNQIKPIK